MFEEETNNVIINYLTFINHTFTSFVIINQMQKPAVLFQYFLVFKNGRGAIQKLSHDDMTT